jgi:hypothetical protein
MMRRYAAAMFMMVAVAPAQAVPREVRVPDGTRLRVKLLQFISSETSRAGEPVRFEVAQDVVLDRIVIRRGTPVEGSIVESSPYRLPRWPFWWRRSRPGRLTFTVTRTESINGDPIRLRFSAEPSGLMTRPPLLRWQHEGEMFDAFVDGDYVVRVPD